MARSVPVLGAFHYLVWTLVSSAQQVYISSPILRSLLAIFVTKLVLEYLLPCYLFLHLQFPTVFLVIGFTAPIPWFLRTPLTGLDKNLR